MENTLNNDLIAYADSDFLLNYQINKITLNKFLQKKIYHLLWHMFHSFSANYPESPSPEQQTNAKLFINSIPTKLSIICSSCGQIKDTFINDSDIDNAVISRTNIINFFIKYHIAVNTLYRTQIVIKNTVYDSLQYTETFITTRYNNEFIKLIKNDYIDSTQETKIIFDSILNATITSNMDSFFTLFHSYVKLIYKTHSDKYNLQLRFSKI
jgi:hypothetical protein